MGKFTNTRRLSKDQQNELFIRFSKALAAVKNPVEAANFIKDLFSEQEALMLARRLQIAELLNDGLTYEDIRKAMKVSHTTIAKVQTWLSLYGEGYRMVLKRTTEKTKNSELSRPWRTLKKSYPMYFWPQLLLEEIVKTANKREKQKLLNVVNGLREKTKLSNELLKILKFDQNSNTI